MAPGLPRRAERGGSERGAPRRGRSDVKAGQEHSDGARDGCGWIYLGAAPGVGKAYAMPEEGQRLGVAGAEVVVGFVEPHGRRHAAEGRRSWLTVRLSPLIAAKRWAAGQVWPPCRRKTVRPSRRDRRQSDRPGPPGRDGALP
ncbi:hypothetical protein ABT224_16580 [Streptomyces sp. NPDC001584]|uniref:hypothetical protein n=1 Tax=Streptomyces sp. NPDC001584 TaxID=3154521 RepID=UPI003333F197